MLCVDPTNHIRINVSHAVVKNTHGYYKMVPIGLVLESKSPNLGSIQLSDGLTSEKFGGTSSSENIISIPGFDQLLQGVIGTTKTKTKRHSFTKKRRVR